MMLISAHSGSRSGGGVMLVQLAPASLDRWIRPSSLPAHSTPAWCGDSARANTVQYTSAPVLSRVTGPPDGTSLLASLRVRSGLITSQLPPTSFEQWTWLLQA